MTVGFLFDLDGVLVDTHRIVIDGWIAFARERGRDLTEDEVVERLFGRRTIDILTSEFGIRTADAAAMVRAGVDDKRAQLVETYTLQPVPGATEFARAALAAGVPCAVVSSASAVNIRAALEIVGLDGAFDVIVDHDQVAHGKPAPDPYLVGAARLDLAATDCVVFEDTVPGIESGRAAGARCVGVASLGRPEMLSSADLVIGDFIGLSPQDLVSRLDALALP